MEEQLNTVSDEITTATEELPTSTQIANQVEPNIENGIEETLNTETTETVVEGEIKPDTTEDAIAEIANTNTPESTATSQDIQSSTETTGESSVIEATAANTRTEITDVSVEKDGTITIGGQPATNEQLQEYFDYTKYDDQTASKIVEGIFKSDTVTINGTTYKIELNSYGELVSLDGKTRLNSEEIKSYLGDKGYEALICKTTKDVTVDEEGKIIINDRAHKVELRIREPDTFANFANTASNKESSESDKSKTSGAKSGGGGYSGGGGGGGYYSGGGGYSSPSTGEIEDAGTPVILVDFGPLGAIRDDLLNLRSQLSEVCEDYTGTINGLSSNGDAWAGVDKDAYISQKKGYASNIGQVSSTLDQFVSYLDNSLNNYEQLEARLAAKQIS